MTAGEPVAVELDQLQLDRWLKPGDGVVFGQACAEPVPLVDALLAQAEGIAELSAFVGLTYRDELAARVPPGLRLVSYGALGRLSRVAELEVIPCHYSALPRLFAARQLPGDVAFVQVSPPDGQGRCSFGPGADYLADAVTHARVVIAEVNDNCPRSAGAWIGWDALDAVIHTSRPLLEAPKADPTDTDRRIAAHVAELIRDGDAIQLGVGSLPEAILAALAGHRRLGVHSGMVSDGVLDLIESGVITGEAKANDRYLTVTGSALGSHRLFDALAEHEEIVMRPTSYTHAPASIARAGRLAAINSALEIDLSGRVNSESINGRRIGAIGGQVDFLRAAAASGGAAILALPAKRIVETLHGPASASVADVDWVVTEHGARSLAGLSLGHRAESLREIAEPQTDSHAPRERPLSPRGALPPAGRAT